MILGNEQPIDCLIDFLQYPFLMRDLPVTLACKKSNDFYYLNMIFIVLGYFLKLINSNGTELFKWRKTGVNQTDNKALPGVAERPKLGKESYKKEHDR